MPIYLNCDAFITSIHLQAAAAGNFTVRADQNVLRAGKVSWFERCGIIIKNSLKTVKNHLRGGSPKIVTDETSLNYLTVLNEFCKFS